MSLWKSRTRTEAEAGSGEAGGRAGSQAPAAIVDNAGTGKADGLRLWGATVGGIGPLITCLFRAKHP